MTKGGHFRHPGGGGSRAKPGISPTWASATCPERDHAPKIATPEVVAGRLLPIAKLQAMMLAHTRTPLAPHPRPPRAANAAHSRAQARAATSLRKPQRGVRPSADGGDDDQRRTFPPPRRWWQPCVAGYFADLGVGDMPGAARIHI